ncbi:MAG: holo-ACP synthase [Cellulosilyticaceae bacterium]
MIIGIGTDIIEVKRIEKALKDTKRFKEKLFTDKENLYFEKINNRIESIAGSFAAKEAVSKALGTGFRSFGMEDIEITRDGLGKPSIILLGEAQKLGDSLGVDQIHLTISHCKDYAVAYAIVEGRDSCEANN